MKIQGEILPKQADFLNSKAKEILYSGAFGAGKSRAICYKTVQRALIKNNPVGLCRKTRSSLKSTTLRTLLKSDGILPPVLPEGTYKHYKQDKIISINDGGEILYFGFDDEVSIASMNLGACGIDEAIELKEEEYTMILGRVRNTSDPLRQVFSATNPGSPRHFLYKRFYKDKSGKRCLINTNSADNFFLPVDYIEMLNGFNGQRKARFVEGLWCAFEGLIYDVFDRDIHVKVREEEWRETFVLCDEGYTNPAVLLYCGIDGDDRLHIISEFYERKVLPETVVETAVKLKAGRYIADPSASGLIASMKSKGLTVIGANNKVLPGIYRVLDRLKVQKDGKPRLTVDPSCTNTIMEFESYQWKKEKEEPVKEFDHSMDAVRYGIMYLDADKINPSISGTDKEKAKKGLRPGDEGYDDIDRDRIMEDEDAWA